MTMTQPSTPPRAVEPEDTLLPPDDQKTLEWIAVLAAADLDYRLDRDQHRWILHVPASQAAAARAELGAYEADVGNRSLRFPRFAELCQPSHHTLAALWGVGLLLAFYAWCGPFNEHDPLLGNASADAEAIMAGQWWRPITALTLHADFSHVAGNALCLLVLGHAVCSLFGGGLGWLLILMSGAAGNFAVAWLMRSGHVSVGASTASFGAIGILVAQRSVATYRRWHEWRSLWSPVWLPLGSGLALLALLGTGPQSDLTAHLFGFVLGVVLAAPFCRQGGRVLPDWAQRLLELACVLAVLSAWAAALRHLP